MPCWPHVTKSVTEAFAWTSTSDTSFLVSLYVPDASSARAHAWRVALESHKDPGQFIPEHGHNLHPFQKPMQGSESRRFVIEQMRGFRRHSFAGEQPTRQLKAAWISPSDNEDRPRLWQPQRAGINQHDAL